MPSWTLASDIAQRIAALRGHLGLTQAEFAARFGRHAKQVGAWENGRQRPRAGTLERIAKAQGWPVEMFAEGGPMPAQVVNRPVDVPERPIRARAGSTAWTRLMDDVRPYVREGRSPDIRWLYPRLAQYEAEAAAEARQRREREHHTRRKDDMPPDDTTTPNGSGGGADPPARAAGGG